MAEVTEETDDVPSRRVSLLEIFIAFTRISIVSIGGGLTAWAHQELVERRRWISEHRFLSALAVCQVLPGGNMVNMSVYTGAQLRGFAGASVALLGLIILPVLTIVGMASLYEIVQSYATTGLALDGVAAAAVGLTLSLGWREMKQNGRSVLPLAVSIAVFVGVGVLRWPLLAVVGVMGPLSVALAFLTRRFHV
jgi:chromate transporter